MNSDYSYQGPNQRYGDGLKEREEKWSDARAEADALGREHGAKLKQAQALVDERRRLIHRDPSLVDHMYVPVGRTTQSA